MRILSPDYDTDADWIIQMAQRDGEFLRANTLVLPSEAEMDALLEAEAIMGIRFDAAARRASGRIRRLLQHPSAVAARWAAVADLLVEAIYDVQLEVIDVAGAYLTRALGEIVMPDPTPFLGQIGTQSATRYVEQTLDVIKARVDAGDPLEEAVAKARDDLASTATTEAYVVGRDAVATTARADDRFIGYARVAHVDACDWCQMLAGRGAVYFEDTALMARDGQPYHRKQVRVRKDGTTYTPGGDCRCTMIALPRGSKANVPDGPLARPTRDQRRKVEAAYRPGARTPQRAASVARQLTTLRGIEAAGKASPWSRKRITELEAEQMALVMGAPRSALSVLVKGIARRHYGPGTHPNGSPQSVHGEGDGGGKISIAKQGGDSVKVDGRRPTTGYMVAKPPSFGTIVTVEQWFERGDELLVDFVLARRAQFDDPDAFIGVWWDRANREFALDVSMNVADLDEAIAKARLWDQQAIWDVVNMVEIPTGGTGGRSGQVGRSSAEGLLDDDPRGTTRVGPHDRRGDEEGLRGRAEVDPEVRRALDDFYLRYDPNQPRDPAGTDTGGQWTRIAVDAGQFWTGSGKANKATADRIRDEMAKYNITFAAVTREMRRRVELAKTMDDPYPDDPDNPATAYESGLTWYSRAHQLAIELGDGDVVKGAGMIAAMSPLTGWPPNLNAVRQLNHLLEENPDATTDEIVSMWRAGAKSRGGHLYDQFGDTGMGTEGNITKAVAIYRGGSVGDILSGTKVRNFYNNIVDDSPSDDSITVDGHMGKVVTKSSPDSLLWGNKTRMTQIIAQDWVASDKKGTLAVAGVGYQFTAAAIRAVAKDLGLRPEQVQAIVWNTAVKEEWYTQKVGDDRPLTAAQRRVIDGAGG